MVKPGVINKKKNVFAGHHKSRARRALKGRAPELNATKEMTQPQRKKRLTNPTANVTFSKKKLRLLNKGKKKDVDMDEVEEEDAGQPAFGNNASAFGDSDMQAEVSGGTTLGAPRLPGQ